MTGIGTPRSQSRIGMQISCYLVVAVATAARQIERLKVVPDPQPSSAIDRSICFQDCFGSSRLASYRSSESR
jgi:hypothetical protein